MIVLSQAAADDCSVINPVCVVGDVVGDVVTDGTGVAAAGVAEGIFGRVATFFGEAANSALTWLWSEIDVASSVDLSDPAVRRPLAYVMGIALVVTVGLFVAQVAVSALRHDPGGVGRALRGVLISTIGTPVVLAASQLALAATDEMSTAIITATTGESSAAELGEVMMGGSMLVVGNPALLTLLSVVVMVATVMVWASLMVRKVLLLITAVLAPAAFAGAASDWTMSWVRKVGEVLVALIISKLVLVILMSMGYNMLVVPASGSATAKASMFGAGLLVLCLCAFAPFAALRLVTFAGGMNEHLRAGSGALGTPGRQVAQIPRKAASLAATGGTLGAVGAGAAAGRSAGGGMGAKTAGGGGAGAAGSAPRPGGGGQASPPAGGSPAVQGGGGNVSGAGGSAGGGSQGGAPQYAPAGGGGSPRGGSVGAGQAASGPTWAPGGQPSPSSAGGSADSAAGGGGAPATKTAAPRPEAGDTRPSPAAAAATMPALAGGARPSAAAGGPGKTVAPELPPTHTRV